LRPANKKAVGSCATAFVFNWGSGGSVTAAARATAATAAVATAARATATTTAVATTTGAATATTAVAATTAAAAAITAATGAATATTEAAAAGTTATTTEAARTLFAWTCLVDHHGATFQVFAVHASDGCLCFCIRAHFYKAEALRTTRFAVHHDLGRSHGPESRKILLKVFITNTVGQVAHVEFVAHAEHLSFLLIQENHVEHQPVLTHSSKGAAAGHRIPIIN
jgi:hypothetical protein